MTARSEVALCIGCHRLTTAPVAVRWIENSSGPGTTLWGCPGCAPKLGTGPALAEAERTATH